MAGRLSTPVVEDLKYDPDNDDRATVLIRWEPSAETDNQGTLESTDADAGLLNNDGMVRFRLRWIYSEQGIWPDNGETGGTNDEKTILGNPPSGTTDIADTADDDDPDLTGEPGGGSPRTAPNNNWNEVSINSRTYFYRDEIYQLDGDPSGSGSFTEIFVPITWEDSFATVVGNLYLDDRGVNKRIWRAKVATTNERPPNSEVDNVNWYHVYTSINDVWSIAHSGDTEAWDQRPHGDADDMDYTWKETIALVEMSNQAVIENKFLWVYARCEVGE